AIQVSDVEVADSIAIGEIGPRASAVEGQVHVLASQMVQAVGADFAGHCAAERCADSEAADHGFLDE
ncbi:hypothetical protein Tco_0495190, partial [Tanacetum coccineum]